MSTSNHKVIIRNLTKSKSISDSNLKDSLFELLNMCIKISTLRNCIKIKKEKKQRYAVILLRNPNEVFEVLDRLKNRRSRNTLGFDFQALADKDVDIDVEMELPERYYRKGQYIGRETRQMEFKLGGGDYVRKYLKEDVLKYVCGYLNGRSTGTLFIGVNDDGHVVGVNCEEEDKIRREYIDQSIRAIKPPVDNKDYNVEFIPVEVNGKLRANCKVIEITVFKKKQLNRLFDSKGHVYMRREGSVSDFTAAEVQDWIFQNRPSKKCTLL
ncbi:Hypothetical predicted protein [Mytilus galloprovincialis]|uniref:Schlafen AlbA-2 domain-containing protein n=1 Tax=Mytilus galloprovincialis TaxID=29158 RepID=A0A8B6C8W6_MYTGA|nr:Hypothetical predicted protein [Mytilus galloprovincialis]